MTDEERGRRLDSLTAQLTQQQLRLKAGKNTNRELRRCGHRFVQ